MKTVIFFACLTGLLLSVQGANQIQKYLELESVVATNASEYQVRMQASGTHTLRVTDLAGTKKISFDVCIKPETGYSTVNFTVDDLQYCNDGGADTISIKLNGTSYASHTTTANFASGTAWNIVKNSGRLGDMTQLPEGNFTMEISVTTDTYGIEFDLIRLYMEYQHQYQDVFCGSKTYA